jgi:hypothetical protein
MTTDGPRRLGRSASINYTDERPGGTPVQRQLVRSTRPRVQDASPTVLYTRDLEHISSGWHLLDRRTTSLCVDRRVGNASGCIHTFAVRSRRFQIVLAVAGILVASLVVGAVVAGLGPSDEVVCGTGQPLDRIAQAITQPLGAGQTDGPAASYCAVPSTRAWIMAAMAFVAVLAGGSLATVSRARRSR